jgi:type IV fimbrial biogenesis protein FimT
MAITFKDRATPPSVRGWTLLQAMVTLLVLAVLCAIALPDFTQLLYRQRASSVRHLLSSDLAFARLSAIRRHDEVGVCPSSDGLACDAAANWGRGWIVYVVRPGFAGPAAAGDILQHQQWRPPSAWRIKTSAARNRIRYLGNGRAYGTNLSLDICRNTHLYGRVVVNNSGRVRSETLDRPGSCAD